MGPMLGNTVYNVRVSITVGVHTMHVAIVVLHHKSVTMNQGRVSEEAWLKKLKHLTIVMSCFKEK